MTRATLLSSLVLASSLLCRQAPAQDATFGCKVLLCAAASTPSWSGIPYCVPVMQQLFTRSRKGEAGRAARKATLRRSAINPMPRVQRDQPRSPFRSRMRRGAAPSTRRPRIARARAAENAGRRRRSRQEAQMAATAPTSGAFQSSPMNAPAARPSRPADNATRSAPDPRIQRPITSISPPPMAPRDSRSALPDMGDDVRVGLRKRGSGQR